MPSSEAGRSPARLLQLGRAFQRAKVLLTAVELGVFSELAVGPLDANDLARRVGIHPRGARDFFDTLVALGLLERRAGHYANTAEAAEFLDPAKPGYVGEQLQQFNRLMYAKWGGLTEALRSGRPQELTDADGGDRWPGRYADPDFLRVFPRAMTASSLRWAQALTQQFPWERYRTFADIGAAEGALAVRLAQAHPHLAGIGFDLPPLQPAFETYVASFGLGERLRFVPGSFLTDPLPAAEVLVLAGILHSWGATERDVLLRKVYAVLPAGGALIIRDLLIDNERRTNVEAFLFSLQMLLDSDGGRAFTGAECEGWLRQAGFRDTRIETLSGPHSMVVGWR